MLKSLTYCTYCAFNSNHYRRVCTNFQKFERNDHWKFVFRWKFVNPLTPQQVQFVLSTIISFPIIFPTELPFFSIYLLMLKIRTEPIRTKIIKYNFQHIFTTYLPHFGLKYFFSNLYKNYQSTAIMVMQTEQNFHPNLLQQISK